MQLLLTLLRILGILILAVILLVLLVVLLVLFVPIRYQVWTESKADGSLDARARIHWLLHLISLTAEYQDELTYRLKIVGIPIRNRSEAKNEREPQSPAAMQPELKPQPEPKSESKPEPEPMPKLESDPKVEPEPMPKQEPESDPEPKSENDSKPTPDTTKKKSLREQIENIWISVMEFIASVPEKIAALFEKWADFQENLGDRVDTLIDKIDELNRKKDRLIRQFQDEQNRFAVKESLRAVGKLLAHIRPRKLKINGRLGFDDPAQTGQVFGIIGMLMPLYGEHIQLEAVFDQKIMEGRLYLSGRIQIGVVLWIALRLIMRKEVRRLIAQVQTMKKQKRSITLEHRTFRR